MPRRKTEKYTKSDCKRWIYLKVRPVAPWTITNIIYKALDLYFSLGYQNIDFKHNYVNDLKRNKIEKEDFSEDDFRI